jgi:hypothetical protein
MGYFPDSTILALRGNASIGIFFRMASTPDPLRLWLGVHDVTKTMVGYEVEDAGQRYLGAGQLLSVPELEILMNGVADRVEFVMNGVDTGLLAKLDEASPTVAGVEVKIGLCTFNDRWQPTTGILPIWRGRADYWTSSQEPQTDMSQPTTHILSLSVGGGETTRSIPARTMWSDAQQKAFSPTDDFCRRVARYARGYTPRWPRY